MFLDAKQNWVITNHHYNVVKHDIYEFNIRILILSYIWEVHIYLFHGPSITTRWKKEVFPRFSFPGWLPGGWGSRQNLSYWGGGIWKCWGIGCKMIFADVYYILRYYYHIILNIKKNIYILYTYYLLLNCYLLMFAASHRLAACCFRLTGSWIYALVHQRLQAWFCSVLDLPLIRLSACLETLTGFPHTRAHVLCCHCFMSHSFILP